MNNELEKKFELESASLQFSEGEIPASQDREMAHNAQAMHAEHHASLHMTVEKSSEAHNHGVSSGSGIRKAHHSYATKSQMVTRMNRIEGQIRGIKKMIENDIYCDDILHQFMSVESAIHGVKTQLLEAHMKSCVVEQIQGGETAVIDELLQTIKKMTR